MSTGIFKENNNAKQMIMSFFKICNHIRYCLPRDFFGRVTRLIIMSLLSKPIDCLFPPSSVTTKIRTKTQHFQRRRRPLLIFRRERDKSNTAVRALCALTRNGHRIEITNGKSRYDRRLRAAAGNGRCEIDTHAAEVPSFAIHARRSKRRKPLRACIHARASKWYVYVTHRGGGG